MALLLFVTWNIFYCFISSSFCLGIFPHAERIISLSSLRLFTLRMAGKHCIDGALYHGTQQLLPFLLLCGPGGGQAPAPLRIIAGVTRRLKLEALFFGVQPLLSGELVEEAVEGDLLLDPEVKDALEEGGQLGGPVEAVEG